MRAKSWVWNSMQYNTDHNPKREVKVLDSTYKLNRFGNLDLADAFRTIRQASTVETKPLRSTRFPFVWFSWWTTWKRLNLNSTILKETKKSKAVRLFTNGQIVVQDITQFIQACEEDITQIIVFPIIAASLLCNTRRYMCYVLSMKIVFRPGIFLRIYHCK